MRTLARHADLADIRTRLLAVHPEDHAQWGMMCAAEMVCHVRGAFLGAMGEIFIESMKVPVPRALFKAAALWVPLTWRRNFSTVPALRQGEPAVLPGRFEADREQALAAMQRFCEPAQKRVDHPFFGAMSAKDWMRWGFLHTDHHLRQFGR